MRFFIKRRIWIGIILIAVILIGYFGYRNSYLLQQAPIGAGVKAKILCSGVFVSKRDPQLVLSEDLTFHPLLDLIKTKIDYEKKSVTASLFGIYKKRAIYREKLGCTLLSGIREENIQSQVSDIPVPLPENPESILWPTGDLLPSNELPPDVDMELLQKVLDEAFSEPYPERPRRTRAVVVVYDGCLIAERYARGITKDTPLIGWSMTKSVTSALAGICVGQGRLFLEGPASVSEWEEPDDPRSVITLDQLLRMSSGLKFIEEYEDNPISDVNTMLFLRPDTAAFAASMPLEVKPGTKWHYSSGTTNLISRIIRHAIGNQAHYVAFPRRALFNRIGMRSAVLEMDASGTFVGSSNMYASARDWARFGLLYLQDGIWEGERILPEGWVAYTTTPTAGAPLCEYGAHFWLNKGNPNNPQQRSYPRLPTDLFCAHGYQHQNTVIIPSRKLVVVRLGMTHRGKGVWDMESFIADILECINYKAQDSELSIGSSE